MDVRFRAALSKISEAKRDWDARFDAMLNTDWALIADSRSAIQESRELLERSSPRAPGSLLWMVTWSTIGTNSEVERGRPLCKVHLRGSPA